MSRSILLAAMLALVGGTLALGSAAAKEPVPLSPLNDSGVGGSVALGPDGEQQTIVGVWLEGSEAGSVHPNHIHTGTSCEDYGAIEVNLTDITVGDDGTGNVTTTVDVSMADVQDGNHVVIVHRGPTLQDDPTPIACAALPVTTGESVAEGEESATAPPADGGSESLPAAGSGGFLSGDSDDVPMLPIVLLAVGVAAFGVGAIGWRLSRTQR